MMTTLLLALLPQADDSRDVPLPAAAPSFLAASSTGRFALVAEPSKVHVLDGLTLAPVHVIEADATALAFDPADETLTIVGSHVLRYDARAWKETFRHRLPDAELEARRGDRRRGDAAGWRPGQALIAPHGGIYYRSANGHLSLAKEVDGKLLAEVLTPDRFEESQRVLRVLAWTPGRLVETEGGLAVALNRKLFPLAASPEPLAVGSAADTLPVVLKTGFNVYAPRSWKCVSAAPTPENLAAAFDPKRSRFYVARADGLRVWDGREEEKALEGGVGGAGALAVDGAGARLYAVARDRLWSWRIKD